MVLKRDQQRDALKLIILSVLSDRDLYGYAIIKQVNARSEGEIRLTAGVLYPLLHELEERKLIDAEWETVQSDRRPDSGDGRRRKWYRITPKGRRTLSKQIEAHRARQRLIESFISEGSGAEGEASR